MYFHFHNNQALSEEHKKETSRISSRRGKSRCAGAGHFIYFPSVDQ